MRREVQKLFDELNGVTAVVVTTIDGYDVASATRGFVDPSRVAAMSSSIAAIGQVVSQEAQIGPNRTMMIVTELGLAVFHRVHRADGELIISVLAREDAVLALVAHRTSQLAKMLTDA
ncbi:hypothetical protein EJP67_29750 [Variovorax guangxiensis]|uniref:Roadblock/LAMTOR2 domain-containing protein n=2 Tax=Variovorax guangxiensis TaxID=1775474 RepID=A0A3S1A741_9BURK|nr:hypothetical protein EJP67_29750 [Variovorax guangxiensis]